MASPINTFLRQNNLGIATNPCVSPDFCLDWESLKSKLQAGDTLHVWTASAFDTQHGSWTLNEDLASGDCAWILTATAGSAATDTLTAGATINATTAAFPATWENLLKLKNAILETDPDATIFPTAGANLGRSTLGIGARFTTLHWPAVDWAMAQLGIGLTANQNSIPRELVYDVDEMLADRLDTVPFPFIGTSVPEGHQGQSVEGMSHGCVLAKLKHGFHQRRIAWSFNADHQPIGGKFDARETALVTGSLLASYITFDLSPELAKNEPASINDIDPALRAQIHDRMAAVGMTVSDAEFTTLLTTVWPAMLKMKRRDDLYEQARANAFTTPEGRAYLRELSIDELPGLTTPETTAIMLALCEAMAMPCNFVAPAFGFQKNIPYPDEDRLRELIAAQWQVCEKFGVSIGFHSGSGKSASNYRIMGEMTGSHLEIKTSGRYTYEMGRALHASTNESDQKLWHDWYTFTVDLAVLGAFSTDATEQAAARDFITASIATAPAADVLFASPAACHAELAKLNPDPGHVLFFEYNFLYVLAADGHPEKAALGDHSPAGYRQRARFYSISDEARLAYSKRVAAYIIFLAETTGLARTDQCNRVNRELAEVGSFEAFLAGIATG